jgi:cAMP phosphodiesterase
MRSIACLLGVKKQSSKPILGRFRIRESKRSVAVTRSNNYVLSQRVRKASNLLPYTFCHLHASEIIGSLVESAAVSVSERKLWLH